MPTSALLLALAAAFLKEPLGGGRLAGAVLVATGVAAIAAA